MNADGQIYFAPEDEIAEEDEKRLRKAELDLAKVGLDALIDEATGYQAERVPDELRKRYRQYSES
jgi:hypothetical protein